MKRSLTGAIALLAGAFTAHCQGTVFFGNYGALSNYVYVFLAPSNVKVGGQDGVTFPIFQSPEDPRYGVFWTVALYGAAGWNDPASSLVQLETSDGQPVTATLADGTTDSVPGTWFSSDFAVVPGTASVSGKATIQIYAWCNFFGYTTNYSDAVAQGLPAGFSATANVIADDAVLPGGNGPGELGNIILSVPIPPPTTLTVTANPAQSSAAGPNSIILTWPSTNGPFILQSTTNLGPSTVWTNVQVESVIINGQNTVTNIISGRQQIFRLIDIPQSGDGETVL